MTEPNILEQIDAVSQDFRNAWKTGNRPSIDQFLCREPDAGQANLFRNLLDIEIKRRYRAKKSPCSREYVQRFPKFVEQIRQVFDEYTMGSAGGLPNRDAENSSFDESDLTQAFGMPGSTHLGDYELIRQLGRGGFGVVYEARHRTRQNVVALKTLPAASEGQEINADRLHKFRKEFRSLSEYNHPNLVGMQTLEVDEGNWFFTMDLIDGTDFLSYVRPNEELNDARLLQSIAQLAIGVIALHEKEIVHRDLKPSNVMVETDGTVKILDFGLVTELQTATDQTASLRSAQFAGTPRYAAPEQLFGDRMEATDWYAFGVMLYEALTGEAPFKGNQMELLRQKQNDDPPLLFGREEVPDDLAQLVDSLLKREPQQRIASADIINMLQIDLETRAFGSKTSHGSNGPSDFTDSVEEDVNLDLSWEEDEVELIGREEQLAQLESAKQELLEKREPVVVFIKGLSGEGKSSLAEKFLRPLRRGEEMLVLSGRCYDRESVPFKVIDSIIEPLVRFLRSSKVGDIAAQLPQDIRLLAYLFPLLRRVEAIEAIPAEGIDQMDSVKRTCRAFAALQDLLVDLSKKLPLVIHVDDLQWGDADSAQALFEWVNSDHAPPLLFLGSYRSDEAADSSFLQNWFQLNEESEATVYEIDVSPLSMDQCVELTVARTAASPDLIRQHANKLFADSGGNPYFLEQLLEGFDPQTGTIRRVPLDEIIADRLGKLAAQASLILEVISVSGQPLSIDEASIVADCASLELGTLTHMRSERLVRLIGSGDQMLVDTYHDKIRETFMAGMSDEQRRDLHLKLAQTIETNEKLSADDWLRELEQSTTPGEYQHEVSNHVVDLAHHFKEANDSRASVYQLLAAEQGLLAYAFEDALDFYQRTETLLPTDSSPNLRYRFWFGMGRVLLWNNDSDVSIEACHKAVGVANNNYDRARGYNSLGNAYCQTGSFDRATRHYDDALACLGTRRPRSLFGKLMSVSINSFRVLAIPASWHSARAAEAKRIASLHHLISTRLIQCLIEKDTFAMTELCLQGSRAAFRSGDVRLVALGHGEAAFVLSALGFHWFGNLCLRRCSRIDTKLNDRDSRGMQLIYQGCCAFWAGNLCKAKSLLRESVPFLRSCGHFGEAVTGLHMLRHSLAYTDAAGAELTAARDVLKVASESNNVQGICWGSYDCASALARRGDLYKASHFMNQANTGLQGERYNMTESIRASTDGFVRLQNSDYKNARVLAAFAWGTVIKSFALIDATLYCLPILIEAIAGPNWPEPPKNADRKFLKKMLWRAWILYYTIPNHQPHLQRVFGRAAFALGKKRKAIRYFEKAIQLAEKKGMDYQRAKSLLDLAAVKEKDRDENRAQAIELLKNMESVIPRAESWLLGDQYDESVVAREFDLEAWEREHGGVSTRALISEAES